MRVALGKNGFVIESYPLHCPDCGGLVKSDTVMFGEPIPRGVLDLCFREIERCDCIIAAGTSAMVYPAARFPEAVKDRGGHLIEANPNERPLSTVADVVLRAPAGESLPLVVERIRDIKGL